VLSKLCREENHFYEGKGRVYKQIPNDIQDSNKDAMKRENNRCTPKNKK
jgi:hypothetical protein